MAKIILSSGAELDILNPDPALLTIQVLAHALSGECRFGNQCSKFYSVARHSIFVSNIVRYQLGIPELAYEGLMHDATEGILGDVITQIKTVLPDYKRIERNMEMVLAHKYQLDTNAEARGLVKLADMMALNAERKLVMPSHPTHWDAVSRFAPVHEDIIRMSDVPGTENRARDRFEFTVLFNQLAPDSLRVGVL